MFFHYLTLSLIVIHTLKAMKSTTVSSSTKMLFWKTFDSKVRVLFHTFIHRETYIRIDYKQRKACSETFFRTVFFENIKIESNSTFLKHYILSLLMVIKMKRLYFRFNFWKKNKENIALLENKKFGKSYFKPSEQTCIFFFPAAQPWWAALRGIQFRIFVPVS